MHDFLTVLGISTFLLLGLISGVLHTKRGGGWVVGEKYPQIAAARLDSLLQDDDSLENKI